MTMLKDVGHQLHRLWKALAKAMGKLARMLRSALAWLMNMIRDTFTKVMDVSKGSVGTVMHALPLGLQFMKEYGSKGSAGPLVVAAAMVLFGVLVMRRMA